MSLPLKAIAAKHGATYSAHKRECYLGIASVGVVTIVGDSVMVSALAASGEAEVERLGEGLARLLALYREARYATVMATNGE